ncbi:MAG: type II CRISPR RNA-guided endonuclease Cas9 [Candidatus Hydrogenedentes bacterium]|nr:type II CRISPR RNA-guided endonuclease Cas9 [Candidatus Hydrogenedentota bacterium]
MRIELARDLKRPKSERKNVWQKNRQNEKQRLDAAKRITDATGNPYPKRDDILKVILAGECKWHCPYTNKEMHMHTLVGDAPQFDIEHIIPYSRSLDNSFMNKTLCYHEENRRKGNRTPWETYGSTPEWEEIIQRVKNFNGAGRLPKLERFQARDLESFEEFSNRQLNDTRYASTLAANFLGLLYGGQVDASGRRRIQAGRGQVTRELRNAWHLNKILGDGGQKSRDDHRHHAIDAVAIALTDAATVAMLSRAASKAKKAGRRAWWKEIKEPWKGFLNEVTKVCDEIVVSPKVSRKVNGPLHEETYYSAEREGPDGKPVRHVRKPVFTLSKPEMRAIVDDVVRSRVQEALDRAGGDIKKLESKEFQPFMTTRSGRRIPIKSVRIRKTLKAYKLGKGHRERYAPAGSNHHMEILEVTDRKGNVKWEDHIVCRLDAIRRKARHDPIIKRDHADRKRFVMSLAPGEIIALNGEDGTRGLFVIRGISKNMVEYARIRDARIKKDIRASGDWGASRVNSLRRANCQKIVIDPLGRVQNAND